MKPSITLSLILILGLAAPCFATPKLLVIGDSISGGYRKPVEATLAGQVEVHRIPQNGGDTHRGLANIEEWLRDTQWDIISFNWGLHDMKKGTPERMEARKKAYLERLETLVLRLKKTNAKLIFVTTTPVPEPNKAGRIDSYVVSFNQGAIELMKKHNIRVCDLYTVVKPVSEKYELESKNPKFRDVHFTPEGYSFMGRELTKAIREELGLD